MQQSITFCHDSRVWSSLCSDYGFMSLYHVLLCLCFDFPCPSLFKFLLCSPLCLPLSVILFPSCFLMCSSPSLPQLASSLLSPHLFLFCSSVSVYVVCVYPSLLVQLCILSVCTCSCHVLSVFPWYVFLGLDSCIFACLIWMLPFVCTLFCCFFVSRALVIHASWLFLYSCIFCFFVDFGFCLLNLASDSPDLASRLSDCTWSHLPSNPAWHI